MDEVLKVTFENFTLFFGSEVLLRASPISSR